MVRTAFLGLCACLLVGCATPSTQTQYYPDQSGHRDAASEKFLRQIHYPYQASQARRRQIERASFQVDVGLSEAQVLALLGPPDFKTDYDGYPPKIPPCQTWTYVHTFKYRAKPGYCGKIFVVTFSKTAPQTVIQIEPFGFNEDGR